MTAEELKAKGIDDFQLYYAVQTLGRTAPQALPLRHRRESADTMTPVQSRNAAYTLALLIPAALMGGALIAQFGFGLPPCEMCWWQRYPHIAAIVWR
jgi:hypothetical protein